MLSGATLRSSNVEYPETLLEIQWILIEKTRLSLTDRFVRHAMLLCNDSNKPRSGGSLFGGRYVVDSFCVCGPWADCITTGDPSSRWVSHAQYKTNDLCSVGIAMSSKVGVSDGVSSSNAFALARRLETPIWVFDTDQSRVVLANEAACRVWRASDEAELQSRDLGEDMSPTVARRLRQYQEDFIRGDSTFSEFWTLYPAGVPTSVKVILSGFTMPDGKMAMMCDV